MDPPPWLPAPRHRRDATPSTRRPPQVTVSFDDQNRIRVLDVDKFAHTEELGSGAIHFAAKNQEFGGLMDGIVEVLDANAKRIEQAKLRAIGMRNRVITEPGENRGDQKGGPCRPWWRSARPIWRASRPR